jgi:3-hydroxybutyrate dehydrogenase
MTGALAGRVAVVTGGSGGIGSAVARGLSADGAEVVIGSRRVRGSQAGSTEQTNARTVDVRSTASVEAFLDEVIERHGAIHVLVTSAGTCHATRLAAIADNEWIDDIDVNLSGVFRCMRYCLPRMIAQRWGRIVNIASDIALLGSPDYPAYCAAKAAVVSLTRSAAIEGAPHNVTCNTISPGWIDTEMARRSLAEMAEAGGADAATLISEVRRAMPRGRFVAPAEIAHLAVQLCGDAAAAVTMQDITVAGGARWYMNAVGVAQ